MAYFGESKALFFITRAVAITNINAAGEYSKTVLDYFAKNGAPCGEGVNPAEHIVEVIQGNTDVPIDWVEVWNQSTERRAALEKLEKLNAEAIARSAGYQEDTATFATSKWFQLRVVLERQMVQLWRSPVRVPNQLVLQ